MNRRSSYARPERVSPDDEARLTAIVAMLVVLGAACLAALIAHVAIDIVGDTLLAHDAYDNVAHASRGIALTALLCGVIGGITSIVFRAYQEALGRKNALRSALEAVGRGPIHVFAVHVVLATVALLAFMGGLDTLLDGNGPARAADLFGGSVALGLTVALASGAAVALAMRCAVRRIVAAHPTIVEAFAALIWLLVRIEPFLTARCLLDLSRTRPHAVRARAKRSGKRAPPIYVA